MIIQSEDSNVKMQGTLETVGFEIKTDDGKMFHILSNLYSNPLGAVVRELSTNCEDGHKIAGTPERPFDIILPGRMDMGNFITFRDYGPGMPHDVVMTIFTTFGSSTKGNSNVETGCLGLGSKSPLAITDSFTVTSINEGMKTVYSVSKDEQRKPVLAMFGSTETDEANGLMVTVPLTDQYVNKVHSEIQDQLEFFVVKPNIYKGDVLQSDYEWHNKKREFFEFTPEIYAKKQNNYKDSRIIQGEIGYSFNSKTLINLLVSKDDMEFLDHNIKMEVSSHTKTLVTKFFEEYELLIFMPMGTVSFAPSREELIYDMQTASNILKEVLKVISLIKDTYQEVYSKIKNNYQYRQLKSNLYQADKILKITEDTKSFLNKIGFGFEKNFRDDVFKLEGGISPTSYGKAISKLDYYGEILEMQLVQSVNYGNPAPKSMIKKTKDRWAGEKSYTKSTGDISEYVANYDYSKIHIVFVNTETKFYKKHIINYVIGKNQDLDGESINVIFIKKEFVSMANVESFITLCGLSMDCHIPFTDVLKESEALIASGKAPEKEYVSTPRTLRVANVLQAYNGPDDWRRTETNTKKIRDELQGLYVTSFNNKIKYTGALELKYPEIYKILKYSGIKRVFDFLNSFGATVPDSLEVYAGHEKNFKKTNLIDIETYIIEIVEKIKYNNAWHALNRETKTYKSAVVNNYDTERVLKNIGFWMGEYTGRTSDLYDEVLLEFQEIYESFEEQFYLADHEIIAAYKKYKEFNVDQMGETFANVNISASDKEKFEALEKYFDVKFEIFNVDSTFRRLDNRYSFNHLGSSINYGSTPYHRTVERVIESIRDEIYDINKTDFFKMNGSFLEEYGKKPIVLKIEDFDDEEESNSAINKHDSLVAE